jgi:hypothetical protein
MTRVPSRRRKAVGASVRDTGKSESKYEKVARQGIAEPARLLLFVEGDVGFNAELRVIAEFLNRTRRKTGLQPGYLSFPLLQRPAHVAHEGLPWAPAHRYIEWVKNGRGLEEGCADLPCPEIRIGGYT